MMATYALSLVLFSFTLAALVLLVFTASRQVFRNEPIVAHRFALMALALVLMALPARYINKNISAKTSGPEANPSTEASAGPSDSGQDTLHELSDALLLEQIGHLRQRLEATQMALDVMPLQETSDPEMGPEGVVIPDEKDLVQGVEPVAPKSRPSRLARLSEFLTLQMERREIRLSLGFLALVHLLGAIWVLRRRFNRYRATRAIVLRARVTKDPSLRQLWREIAGARASRIEIRVSDEIDSPACFGLWRPVLLLPSSSLRRHDKAALAWALRHEFVHIRRGDCLVSPFQHLLVALAWFHPAAWWLERELVRLRELSCDHVVVQKSGARKSYALALIEFAEERSSRAGYAAPMDAPAFIPWSGGKSFLQRRIEMLAHSKYKGSTTNRIMRLAVMSTTCLAVWFADMGLAAAIPGPQEPPAHGGEIIIVESTAQEKEIEVSEVPVDKFVRHPEFRGVTTTQTAPPAGRTSAETFARHPDFIDLQVSEVPDISRFFAARQDESPRLGLNLGDVNATLAAQLGLEQGQGLVVESVVARSPSENAGLKMHDVIARINGKAATLAVLRAERDKSGGKSPIVVEIRRLARPMILVIWSNRNQDIRLGDLGHGAAGGFQVDLRKEDGERAEGRISLGMGGGSGAGPTFPSQRTDYMREIEALQKQLAELESRLRRDPQVNRDLRIREDRAPRQRVLRLGNPLEKSEATDASPNPRVGGFMIQENDETDKVPHPLYSGSGSKDEAARRSAEIAAKISHLSAQREALREQLALLHDLQDRMTDGEKKKSVLERMDRMATELNTLEVEILRIKEAQLEIKELKTQAKVGARAAEKIVDPRRRDAETIPRLEQALAEASANRGVLEDRLNSLKDRDDNRIDKLKRAAELQEGRAQLEVHYRELSERLEQHKAQLEEDREK